MCGITGFFGDPKCEPLGLLRTLNEAQFHRGPDDEGLWISPCDCVGLGHRRLSIVDLSHAGHQPMCSESGRYVITFNGEIYNFLKLRKELSSLGHIFRSSTDTEVMLAAFEEWGVRDALPRLNGMFAAAVWDQSERALHLFRDRLGLKPLYYQWHEGTLYFSSEINAKFSHLSQHSICREALALYLHHGCVPAPYSIYEGIWKLMPGILATASSDSAANHYFAKMSSYWDTTDRINGILETRKSKMDEIEALELLDETLRRSIRDRMIADVPLGAFLSGGVDSSLVVSYMQQVSNAQVRTFSIGFDEIAFSEAHFARKVAEHLGTVHTEMTVTEKDALDVVDRLPGIYGEPFADSSQIPTYLVSKLTRRYVTVALSGDGGDELFAGYNNYRSIAKYERAASLIPRAFLDSVSSLVRKPISAKLLHLLASDQQVTRLLTALSVSASQRPIQLADVRWASATLPERLVKGAKAGSSIRPLTACSGNPVERAMCDDLVGYLPDDILVKVDRASMAVSLEVRAPFVDDFEIFEAAWRIPFALKMDGLQGKIILRKLLARFIRLELTERPKSGFAVPLTKWIRGALREWVHDYVSGDRLKREGFLNSREVEKVRRRAIQGSEFYSHKLWAICQFQAWLANSRASLAANMLSIPAVRQFASHDQSGDRLRPNCK